MNYESELQESMVNQLSYQYGIEEKSALYAYFQLRYAVWKLLKPKDMFITEVRYQVEFLLSELNIPSENGSFQYKGEKILSGFSLENSMQNIMESWNYEQSNYLMVNEKGISVSMEQYLDQEWKKIKRKATNKAKAFKKTSSYPHYLRKYALQELNAVFCVTPIPPDLFPHVYYPESYNQFGRTMEEESVMYVHSEELKRMDTKTISEKDIEEFLRFRLEYIEEGLKYVDHQYVIPDGRIDILARDNDNVYVIIELKIVDDKDLVWQCMYYPEALKKKLNVSHVRMITLSPSYSPSLLLPLKQLSHVEIMTFTPIVELGIIKDLIINARL